MCSRYYVNTKKLKHVTNSKTYVFLIPSNQWNIVRTIENVFR